MNSISHIRARLGVTQLAMAKGIAVTQGSISNYERGDQNMSPAVAKRLIRYAKSLGYEITLNDIYDEPAPQMSGRRHTDHAPAS